MKLYITDACWEKGRDFSSCSSTLFYTFFLSFSQFLFVWKLHLTVTRSPLRSVKYYLGACWVKGVCVAYSSCPSKHTSLKVFVPHTFNTSFFIYLNIFVGVKVASHYYSISPDWCIDACWVKGRGLLVLSIYNSLQAFSFRYFPCKRLLFHLSLPYSTVTPILCNSTPVPSLHHP